MQRDDTVEGAPRVVQVLVLVLTCSMLFTVGAMLTQIRWRPAPPKEAPQAPVRTPGGVDAPREGKCTGQALLHLKLFWRSQVSEPTAYPLQWPLGWPRTREPKRSAFSKKRTVAEARDALLKELRRLDAYRETVSSNVLLRRDGLPRSDGRPPLDSGVAVYFWLIGDPRMRVLACDRWQTVPENLHAITLHIEALRALERYGVGTMERVLEGYALPASSSIERPWWQVLGVSEFATQEEIQAAFREKAREVHPDRGGSTDAMAALNQARDRALGEWEELRRKGVGR